MKKVEAEEMAVRMDKLPSVCKAVVVPIIIQWAGATQIAGYDVEVTVTDPVFYHDVKDISEGF